MYNPINNYFTGDTALIAAAWRGYTDIVKMLLENENIDVNIKNIGGKYLFYT